MYKKGSAIRTQIINIANNLFYHQGFNQTSFADIAKSAQIPKGNFYHYFKSKEEILECIFEQRLQGLNNQLQAISEQSQSPIERISLFINSLKNNKNGFAQYGCPTGSMCTELGKTQKELQKKSTDILEAVHVWSVSQFQQSGLQPLNANKLSRQMIIRVQGAALISHAYRHETYFIDEINEILDWLDNHMNSGSNEQRINN